MPTDTAFIFLNDEGESAARITYGELDLRARVIAGHLQSNSDVERRPVILLLQPGIEYIATFFGCLYAGAIPVPAYPPKAARHLPRLQSILADTQATTACTTTNEFGRITRMKSRTGSLPIANWILVDRAQENAAAWHEPALEADSVAFLQYTSGSTDAPKGVMVSHRNVLTNLKLIGQRIRARADDVSLFWLPPYHDFGLIGGILYPVFHGHPSVLMRPTSFLLNPYRWLKAIHDYKATISGASDVAYDLCARRITTAQCKALDLSRWRVALNGGEPIYEHTLEAFSEAFATCGFRPEAWLPAYGLAESTLMVSGALRKTHSGSHVSSGPALARHQVAIVDPVTCERCGPGTVGEIWVHGPCVAEGYWNRVEQSQQTFHAKIGGVGRRAYLRTGDLGFLRDGELYFCGRMKDLIVINGRSMFPQDVEKASYESDPRLRVHGAAAFSVRQGSTERLVVAQELEFRAIADESMLQRIAASVFAAVGMTPEIFVLVKPGNIPRTTSGKIQRQLCKRRFMEGTLDAMGRRDRYDNRIKARPARAA